MPHDYDTYVYTHDGRGSAAVHTANKCTSDERWGILRSMGVCQFVVAGGADSRAVEVEAGHTNSHYRR